VVALLHDVAEDANGKEFSLDFLFSQGLTRDQQHALRLLTRASGVRYMEYIEDIKKL
jgi:hypothetical protein